MTIWRSSSPTRSSWPWKAAFIARSVECREMRTAAGASKSQVGVFHAEGKEPDLAALEEGLKFRSSSDKTRVSYRDHVNPETDRAATWAAARLGRQLGDLIVFVPGPEARDVTREILAEMSKSAYGPASFTFPVHNLARFHRPLFKVPTGKVAFSLWLFPRTVPAGDASAHAALVAESRRLFEKMRSVGGKCYIAHSAVPFPRIRVGGSLRARYLETPYRRQEKVRS